MFNFKLNSKNQRNILIIVAVAVAVFVVCRQAKKSGYSPLKLSKEPACDINKLKYGMECVPGPQATASPYTKNLTPGGVCGIQECVRSQAEDYEIVDGIGGSLL